MKLKVLGSNSSGNCYILENDTEALIIEAGVHFHDVKIALNFNIAKVVALLVSHEHGDHGMYAKHMAAEGIPVLGSKGTLTALNITQGRTHPLQAYKTAKTGRFSIMPFNVIHDCSEPFGYIINHPETGNVVFATDTRELPVTFDGLNNILIEANFSEEIVAYNIRNEQLSPAQQRRTENSHMSLEQCITTLKENDLSAVNNIVLIHLSSGNANAEQFKRRVEQETGKTVSVATKGLEINFNKTPF